ncbi:Cdgsh iron-sulfur domain-containing protein [Thalictrum thalictroides]|uniref:Cdgsh iron-sulfur domain-containing protein n=1 Tax=Thalictrum thalictroides TaxID=46969 RepID=A0A7J6X9X4_THATH|nr:Cdgsh iron-sulfur domain-containing protein [Thalictrum thalictroides]
MASIVNTVSARFSYNPSLLKNHQSNKVASIKVGRVRGFSIKAEAINPQIRKEEAKVVDSVVVTELSKPLTAYCRCWRSGTFPLCDGSHAKYNKETGDNVGPLLLKKQ